MAHERISQYISRGPSALGLGRASELVEDHPGYSALSCFAVGVAIGAAVSLLLTSAKTEKTWYEKYLPDEDFVEELSDQVRQTVRKMLPGYLKRR